MSTSSDGRGRTHTIIWKIENFSMITPAEDNRKQVSTSFVLGLLSDAKVWLMCFPDGQMNWDYVAIVIKRSDDDEGPNDVHLGYELSVITAESEKEFTEEYSGYLSRGGHLGPKNLVKRKKIKDKRYLYLPNDTFTIRCEFWWLPPERTKSVYTMARSIVSTEKMSFHWVISNFIERTEKATRIVPTMPEVVFEMRAYLKSIDTPLTDPEADAVVIDVRKISAANHSYMLKARISVLDESRKQWYLTDGEHIFTETGENWEHPIQLERHKLLGNKESLLPEGYLTLFCELTVAGGNVSYQHVDSLVKSPSVPKRGMTLIEDLKQLLRVQVYWDVLLTCEKITIPAQRWLLSARSSVFKQAIQNMALLSQLGEAPSGSSQEIGLIFSPIKAREDEKTMETKQSGPEDGVMNMEVDGKSQTRPAKVARGAIVKCPGKALIEQGDNETMTLDVDYYSSLYRSGHRNIDISGPYSLQISEISLKTLKRLLKFMYLDDIDKDVDRQDCALLYNAGRRFKVPSLVRRSVHLLEDQLHLSNVYSTLVWANQSKEEGLKKRACDLLYRNLETEMVSEGWDEFATNNPLLCGEVLRYMRLKRQEAKEMEGLTKTHHEEDDDSDKD